MSKTAFSGVLSGCTKPHKFAQFFQPYFLQFSPRGGWIRRGSVRAQKNAFLLRAGAGGTARNLGSESILRNRQKCG